jgi:hypothetical protein
MFPMMRLLGPTQNFHINLDGYRVEDVFDAWVGAADEATQALDHWHASTTSDRSQAYAVYCAALDREERAANVLEALVLHSS